MEEARSAADVKLIKIPLKICMDSSAVSMNTPVDFDYVKRKIKDLETKYGPLGEYNRELEQLDKDLKKLQPRYRALCYGLESDDESSSQF